MIKSQKYGEDYPREVWTKNQRSKRHKADTLSTTLLNLLKNFVKNMRAGDYRGHSLNYQSLN